MHYLYILLPHSIGMDKRFEFTLFVMDPKEFEGERLGALEALLKGVHVAVEAVNQPGNFFVSLLTSTDNFPNGEWVPYRGPDNTLDLLKQYKSIIIYNGPCRY